MLNLTGKSHIHLWDVPNSYFPRNRLGLKYRYDIIRMVNVLQSTELKVQHSAVIASYNIRLLLKAEMSRTRAFQGIEDVAYHYENFCSRVYSYRDKVLQFLNAALSIGYEEGEVNLKNIVINPTIKNSKNVGLLKKFDKIPLKTLIEDRNSMTHKLYFGLKFDHYFRPTGQNLNLKKDWLKEISYRANMAHKAMMMLSDMSNDLAWNLVEYKNKLKKR